MTGKRRSQLLPLPPTDLIVQLNALEERVWKLENEPRTRLVKSFTAPGPRGDGQFFPPKVRARYDYVLVEVSLTIGEPVDEDSVGGCWIDGSLAWTLTVDAGDDVEHLDLLDTSIAAGSKLQVSIESNPGGAGDWVWQWTMWRRN